jgi:hypothetical protein
MQKIFKKLFVLMCGCIMATFVLTACEKEKDEFTYTIIVEPGGILTGANAVYWRNSVMNIYQTALGTDSEKFTKHGSQEECDREVLDACKRAEMSLSVGGSGEVKVHNNTANKTVYRRIIQ